MKRPQTVPFLGFQLGSVTTAHFVEWVVGQAGSPPEPVRVGYLNAATVNLAFEDPEAAALFAGLDLLYADGLPIVWASRYLGRAIPERVNAADFTLEFFRACAAQGRSVALVGGYPTDAAHFATHYRIQVPDLRVVYVRNGFFDETEAEEIGAAIEKENPDIVLVGMGAPRQEKWVTEWSAQGRPRVWWCVGALFEYGPWRRKRAPVWMRRAGLEWLFRFAQEPRRLAKRYLFGNPKFIWRVLRRKTVRTR